MTKEPSTPRPTADQLQVGTGLRVEWQGTWWTASVRQVDEHRVKIGFDTQASASDEWLPKDSHRIHLADPEDLAAAAREPAAGYMSLPSGSGKPLPDFPTEVPSNFRNRPFVAKPYNPEKEFQKRQLRLREKIAMMQKAKLGAVDPDLEKHIKLARDSAALTEGPVPGHGPPQAGATPFATPAMQLATAEPIPAPPIPAPPVAAASTPWPAAPVMPPVGPPVFAAGPIPAPPSAAAHPPWPAAPVMPPGVAAQPIPGPPVAAASPPWPAAPVMPPVAAASPPWPAAPVMPPVAVASPPWPAAPVMPPVAAASPPWPAAPIVPPVAPPVAAAEPIPAPPVAQTSAQWPAAPVATPAATPAAPPVAVAEPVPAHPASKAATGPGNKVQWEEVLDANKERYYHEIATGKTQWELPDAGWVELLADDGAAYYWEPVSDTTQWYRPGDANPGA